MAYHSINDYIQDKLKWEHTLGRIVGGKMMVFINGQWVTHKEYPMPNYEPAMRCNPDGTKVGNPYPSKDKKQAR